MDKLKQTGRNLGRIFNLSDCMHDMHLFFYEIERPNLELKTWANNF